MPDETPSSRGHLLTLLIFGALILAGVLLLWYYTSTPAEAPEQPDPVPSEDVRHLPSEPQHYPALRV